MEEYVEEAIDTSSDEKILGLYDRELHEERLKNTLIREAEEKGYSSGKSDGISENKKIVAKNMLENGLDIEMIIKCTNLSKEEIEKL